MPPSVEAPPIVLIPSETLPRNGAIRNRASSRPSLVAALNYGTLEKEKPSGGTLERLKKRMGKKQAAAPDSPKVDSKSRHYSSTPDLHHIQVFQTRVPAIFPMPTGLKPPPILTLNRCSDDGSSGSESTRGSDMTPVAGERFFRNALF